MKIVYQTKIYCKPCQQYVPIHLYSDDPFYKVTDEVKKDVLQFADHNHWCNNHRVCAICGEIVQGKDLDLIVSQDFKKKIHPRYHEWQKYPDHGLLTIHHGCLSAKLKND